MSYYLENYWPLFVCLFHGFRMYVYRGVCGLDNGNVSSSDADEVFVCCKRSIRLNNKDLVANRRASLVTT